MIAHWIDRRDPETITDRAVRSAAPTLHHDVVFAAKIHNVPDDQKIAGKSQLRDKGEFFFKLTLNLGADRSVTLLSAEPSPAKLRAVILPLVVRLPPLWESAEFPIALLLVHSGT